MYLDGEEVDQNPGVIYTANQNPPELGEPSDLGIGAYNRASGLGNNAFEGDVDEFAFYSGYMLTPEQVREHYQTATNPATAGHYPTLVLTAASTGDGTQRQMPATYLRFSEPAPLPAADARARGDAQDAPTGVLLRTVNDAAGPRPPLLPGFEDANSAVPLDGTKGWVALGNPPALDLAGQLTLEAWIKPEATQGPVARVVSHGPPTLSNYLEGPPPEENGSVLAGAEVYLRLEDDGATYAFGTTDGTNTFGVTFPVPAGDLGGADWIHLAGTYDGTAWRLFRNGAEVASSPAAQGAFPVPNGDWAIGAAGNGWVELFAGLIDEVAIYPQALTPARIAAHYAAGSAAGGELSLAIARTGGQVRITWEAGVLQQAATVTGPYADVPGAASPYTPPAGPAEAYFRLRQ
ncbi:MAG TPA: LamG domain-containing protein [Verrucomicrobiota bacterium]|nr:LamG domain-containing protein [Verrucomicrobiota bacterium]